MTTSENDRLNRSISKSFVRKRLERARDKIHARPTAYLRWAWRLRLTGR
jgi:hypothetical protein